MRRGSRMEKDRWAVSGEKPKGERVLNQKGLQSAKQVPCGAACLESPGLPAEHRFRILIGDAEGQ